MLARRMGRVSASAIMELIKQTAGGGYISFASGLPDPSLYPLDEIARITAEVLAEDGRAALQYGAAEGYQPLRELAADILRRRGLPVQAEDVLITTGSQQALDLCARALLDPGDRVLIESPSYLAAIQTFDSYEATYLPQPLDDQGMCLDGLEEALAARPKLIYLLPNFQNPTGLTLPAERRLALAEAAARTETAVIEDDAYHDLRYEGRSEPSVCSLAANPMGLYVGSFSKAVAPGLRVGYVAGPAAMIERLAQLKQITDLHTGSFTQRVLHRYCAAGLLEPGLDRFRSRYRSRRDAMLRALEGHMGPAVRWTRPEGGMFIWLTLPPGMDAREVLRKAMEAGVVFVPGADFHPCGGGENTLRLNFVSENEQRIQEGIGRLASVIDASCG